MALNALGEELKQLGCQVLAVARATTESALKWQNDKSLTAIPLLLDQDLHFYRRLGLRRSVTKVWSIPSMVDYAESKVAKVPPSPAYSGDDMHVIGGDFVVDASGKLCYCYPSKTAADRPTTADLLKEIESFL